jgi:Flp pilus assembly protein CpaB
MQAAESLLPRAHIRLRRLDLRVAVGLLLMLVAVFGGASLIKSAQARTPVLVAAGTVQPGEVIKASDVRVAELSLSGGVSYMPASMRTQIVGRVATEPLWEGKLLSPNSISSSPPLPPGTVAMSLLLKPDRAVAGSVRAGDFVAVISSSTPGRADSQTTLLLTSVPVLSVTQATTADGSGVIVTLRLRLEEARALAAARSAGAIDLVLLPGAPS